MALFSNSKFSQLTLWRWFYHPLVLTSVALHSLLLVAPLPSALDPEKTTAEAEPLPEPEEEIIPVDILNLAPPTAAPPAAKPPVQHPQPSARPPVPPSAEKLAQLQETLPPEELENLQAETEQSDSSGTDQSEDVEADTSTFDGVGQGRFVGSLEAVDYGNFDQTANWSNLYSALIDRYLPPEERSLFFNGDRQPVADVSIFKYITRNVELVASEDLAPTAEAAGLTFDVTQYELYGNQRLYTLINAEGTPAAYVSLVDLRGGTAVLVWQSDPRQI